MATHSGILAWRIPWTQEPGGLHPRGGRVGHGHAWATVTVLFVFSPSPAPPYPLALSLFFKLKNKSPSKEDSPFLNWFLYPPDLAFLMSSLHFGAVSSCAANPQEQKISAFLRSYVKGAGTFAW